MRLEAGMGIGLDLFEIFERDSVFPRYFASRKSRDSLIATSSIVDLLVSLYLKPQTEF